MSIRERLFWWLMFGLLIFVIVLRPRDLPDHRGEDRP